MYQNVDRLSILPDNLVQEILSRMPTVYAVQTSILSKRWRSTWRSVYNLDFDDLDTVFEGNLFWVKFVEYVLERCNTSAVDSFKLSSRKNYISENLVLKWIGVAVQLNACKLDFQYINITLPQSLLISTTLTNLRLDSNRLDFSVLDSHSPISLPCVKTLDISVFSDLDDNVFKLIHGCPVLECLKTEIKKCVQAQHHHYKIATLKQLKLSVCQSKTLSYNQVRLSVPNLERLDVDDGILCSEFVMEDLSSLNEAKVSCRVKDARLWVELLTGISKVKSLSLETVWETLDQVWGVLPEFPNLKKLNLKGNVGRQGELTLQILKCCPELENISIEEVEGVEWNAPAEAVPFCMERNLKTLKFTVTTINGALGYEFDAQLVKYLLAHSEVLNKLTVAFDPMVAKEDEETLCAELMRSPKASKDCTIIF
ncbi:FBD-like protein [Tanacetum coccineum]